MDRLIFGGLYRLAPTVISALAIGKPETVIKWHRAGFRSYCAGSRGAVVVDQTIAPEIRKLVREMSIANPLWGAPRIRGELLKLGIGVRETSVDDTFCGLASQLTQPQYGSQIRSRKHVAGDRLPAISFVTGTGPVARVFIRRLRSMAIRGLPTSPHAHDKTHMLKG